MLDSTVINPVFLFFSKDTSLRDSTWLRYRDMPIKPSNTVNPILDVSLYPMSHRSLIQAFDQCIDFEHPFPTINPSILIDHSSSTNYVSNLLKDLSLLSFSPNQLKATN
eukprot:jgi/Psemu1/47014/gm1.47014_g